MFSDKATKDLAKTAFQIMTKHAEEREMTPQEELSESTQIDEVNNLAELIDSLLIEGIAQYIGLFEEEVKRELNEEEITEMTNNIMEEIEQMSDEQKIQLGESLIEAHRNSLTED